MTGTTDLARIVEVSRLRAATQARRLAAAQSAVAQATEVLSQAEAARSALTAEIDALRTKAKAAFVGSPQTAFAVEQMLSQNQAHDRRIADAQSAIDEANEALTTAKDKAADEARALGEMERTVKKREDAREKLSRKDRKVAERKAEDILAETATTGAVPR